MHWLTAIWCHQRCKSMPGISFHCSLLSLTFLILFSLKQPRLNTEICILFVMSQAPIYVNKSIVLEDAIKIGYGGRPQSTKPIFNVILDRFFLVCLWIPPGLCDSVTVANHIVVSSFTALQRDQIPYRRSLNYWVIWIWRLKRKGTPTQVY